MTPPLPTTVTVANVERFMVGDVLEIDGRRYGVVSIAHTSITLAPWSWRRWAWAMLRSAYRVLVDCFGRASDWLRGEP